ncbi:MAG TPA: hypothetical protein VFZ98_06830, partial [Vicinamibacterales bacterium]
QIADEERQKADDIAITAAGAKASDAMNTALWGEGGALTKKGQDAFNADADAHTAYWGQISQIQNGLTNDRQKQSFAKIANNNWNAINEQVQKHVAAQRTAYDTDSTDALVANSQNAAMNAYADPKIVQSSINQMTAAITSYGQRNGWSADETTQALAKQLSTTHVGILSRMLANEQHDAAATYYAAHKDEIAGAAQDKIQKALDVGATQADALRTFNAIMSGQFTPGLETAGNIDLTKRPRVQNADGSISTVRSMSFERDGKEILVPTVSDDGKILNDDEAIAQYDRTGKHLGIFSSDAAASAYAKKLHDAQQDMIEGRGTGVPKGGRDASGAEMLDGSTNTAPVTATSALAQAESITDPKVREETLKLVTLHFNELDRAQREDRENARARVLKDMRANGGRLNQASPDWQLIDGYPEGDHVLEVQKQLLHPPRDPGDPDKVTSYIAMAATSPATRQALLATPIADIVNDETMNSGQKTRVINLIKGEREKDYQDLKTQAAQADKEAKGLAAKVQKARDERDQDTIDENTGAMYAAQQRAKVLQGQLIQATRARGHQTAADRTHGSGGPAQIGGAAAADTPADTRTAANPVGLTPADPEWVNPQATYPLTAAMLHDIARKGPRYAKYLADSGYIVPRVLPKLSGPAGK